MIKKFKQLLHNSYKSEDTEEWLDVHFTRPIGLVFALLWNRLGIHPNAITLLSIVLGMAAGYMFFFTDMEHNLMGVLLLMLANFCDSTDGQMARITGKKTLIGRMLDGFAGDVWFACIYIAIGLRLMPQDIPFTDLQWGLFIWPLLAVAGIYAHAPQAALADYYRQIHLFFLLGKKGSELNSYREQRKIYEQARAQYLTPTPNPSPGRGTTPTPNSSPGRGTLNAKLSALTAMAFYYNYANYCRGQEKRTPHFQQFIRAWKEQPNEQVRMEFLNGSRPLMPFTNILTFNTRAIVLYVSCLTNMPWLYPLFEITVMQALMCYMHHRHETLCARLIPAFSTSRTPATSHPRTLLFDFGGTLDTHGTHWGKMFWHAYRQQGIDISEQQLRDAYVYAERTLGTSTIIKPEYTFKQTIDEKLRLQLQYLSEHHIIAANSNQLQQWRTLMLNRLYDEVQQNMNENRKLLEELSREMQIGIVTNFYGNMKTVLKEFSLAKYVTFVVESAIVGVRKPNPRIFELAKQRSYAPTFVIGDSYEKDIVPAKQAGLNTVWLKGEGWNPPPADCSQADYIITNINEIKNLNLDICNSSF